MNYQPCVGASGRTAGEAAAGAALTKSFNSLLGLKKGMRLGGTSTLAPVLGFRPVRPRRWRVRKLPKPRISILSPPCRAVMMLSKIVSTMISDSLRGSSVTRTTSSTKSALVIVESFMVVYPAILSPALVISAPVRSAPRRLIRRAGNHDGKCISLNSPGGKGAKNVEGQKAQRRETDGGPTRRAWPGVLTSYFLYRLYLACFLVAAGGYAGPRLE